MIPVFKFAGGFIGNALTQAVRILCNAISCLILASLSATTLALAVLQFAGGGTEQGKKTARHSWATAKKSFKSGSFALVQTLGLATCASPLTRAAQACSEPISPKGIFTPGDGERNPIQKVLGLNSWTVVEKETQTKAVDPPEESAEKKSPNVQIEKRKRTEAKKKIRAKKKNRTWSSLALQYIESNTASEMDVIRARMALEHPAEYLQALNAAIKITQKKRAARFRISK